jgi:hypothetical protein
VSRKKQFVKVLIGKQHICLLTLREARHVAIVLAEFLLADAEQNCCGAVDEVAECKLVEFAVRKKKARGKAA